MKLLLFVLLAIGAWLPLNAAAGTVDGRYPVASQAGIIEAVDFATASMIVSGYHYQVAIDARVEIGGTHGAFTMLRPDMRIRFDYLHISGTERRIILVQELPANVMLEET
jgi:hypothetical protein